MAGRISDAVRQLGLSADQVIIAGSAILEVLGIRQASDIDLVVNKSAFKACKQLPGAKYNTKPTGEQVVIALPDGQEVEIWQIWHDYETGRSLDLEELKANTTEVGGFRFFTIDYLKRQKQARGLQKDLRDIKLINEHLKVRDVR